MWELPKWGPPGRPSDMVPGGSLAVTELHIICGVDGGCFTHCGKKASFCQRPSEAFGANGI